MFNIELTNEKDDFFGESVYKGRIVAGDLDEYFRSETSWWSKSDYEESWIREIMRLIRGDTDVAVLITKFSPPESANFLQGYALYDFCENVIIQEQMFVIHNLEYVFNPCKPGEFLEYSSTTEEGEIISEWKTKKEDLRIFVKSHESC
ncbi:hypothetical protein J2S53_001111 [Actinopolyspora lacussalsi]|nr:hypothetical protein [Actinopolyspora lacussalsi]